MTELKKIDYMIASLQVVRDEAIYAENFKKMNDEDKNFYDCGHYQCYHREPNGTIIRESLKQVGRMAYVIAKDVILTPYCKEVFRKNRRLYKWGDR